STDWRKPKLILWILEFRAQIPPDSVGIVDTPKPDVRIQKNSQSRRTSQSSGSLAGDTISPTIFILPFMNPIQSFGASLGDAGPNSATGLPNLVIRTRCLVFWTSSTMARHLALNSEIAISLMVIRYYHGQKYWSN